MQRHLAQQMSRKDSAPSFSSSEDENSGDGGGSGGGGGDDDVTSEVVCKVFGSYDLGREGDRTRKAILGAFQKGQSACLICISTIK